MYFSPLPIVFVTAGSNDILPLRTESIVDAAGPSVKDQAARWTCIYVGKRRGKTQGWITQTKTTVNWAGKGAPTILLLQGFLDLAEF